MHVDTITDNADARDKVVRTLSSGKRKGFGDGWPGLGNEGEFGNRDALKIVFTKRTRHICNSIISFI